MKNWFIVDEKKDTIWTEVLDASDIARAITEAYSQWDWLTAYDKKQRNAFYIALAEEDEDGEMDFETIDKTVDIMNLDDEILRAADIIAEGNFDAAVNLMDDEIREAIHFDNPEMSKLEFLAEYLKGHEKKFGEEFTI